jgi:hypothetical protein
MPGNIEMKIAVVKSSEDIAAQLEEIAVKMDSIAGATVLELAKFAAKAHELFRYKRDEGGYAAWMESRLGYSRTNAYRLLDVHNQFGSEFVPNLGHIGRSAIFLLAAPSTPDEVRTEVVNEIKAGKQPSYAEVKATIDRHKASDPPGTTAIMIDTKAEPAEVETADVVVLRDWNTGIETVVPADGADQDCAADPDHADDADGQAIREFFAADPAEVATKMVAIVGPSMARAIINEVDALVPLKVKAATGKPFVKTINLDPAEVCAVDPRDHRFRQ